MKPEAEAVLKQRAAGFAKDIPSTYCLPLGVPLIGVAPFPHKIVQAPGLMVFLFDEPSLFRQIFMDGRPSPPTPTRLFLGHSVGRWDGDSLVVETVGLRDGGWLDAFGHPHSGAMRVTERFTRPTMGTMEVQVTIDDPQNCVRPFTYAFVKRLLPDTELIESVCENAKDRPHMVGQ
jgi:hypothetical protein